MQVVRLYADFDSSTFDLHRKLSILSSLSQALCSSGLLEEYEYILEMVLSSNLNLGL